jgi:hypothetical protein
MLELTKDDCRALVRALSTSSNAYQFGLTTERRTALMAAFAYMADVEEDAVFPYVLVAKQRWLLTRRTIATEETP